MHFFFKRSLQVFHIYVSSKNQVLLIYLISVLYSSHIGRVQKLKILSTTEHCLMKFFSWWLRRLSILNSFNAFYIETGKSSLFYFSRSVRALLHRIFYIPKAIDKEIFRIHFVYFPHHRNKGIFFFWQIPGARRILCFRYLWPKFSCWKVEVTESKNSEWTQSGKQTVSHGEGVVQISSESWGTSWEISFEFLRRELRRVPDARTWRKLCNTFMRLWPQAKHFRRFLTSPVVYMYTCIYIIYMFTCTYIWTCIYMYMHVYMYLHVCTCIHVFACIYMYTCKENLPAFGKNGFKHVSACADSWKSVEEKKKMHWFHRQIHKSWFNSVALPGASRYRQPKIACSFSEITLPEDIHQIRWSPNDHKSTLTAQLVMASYENKLSLNYLFACMESAGYQTRLDLRRLFLCTWLGTSLKEACR